MTKVVRNPPAPCGAGRAAGLALFIATSAVGATGVSESDRPIVERIVEPFVAPFVDPSVDCADGRISVTGNDVPIVRILETLAYACGISISMHAPIDESASFRIENLPAGRALKRILGRHSFVFIADRQSSSSRLLVLGDGTAGPAVARVIRPGPADDDADRQEQVYRLGERGSGGVADELLAALDDPDRDVREAAVETLIEIGGEAAARAIAVALNDPDIDVREGAVDALGHIGGGASVQLLRGLVTDAHPVIREAAEDSLVELGGVM